MSVPSGSYDCWHGAVVKRGQTDFIKQSLLFFGSFVFGHTAQRAIHELGHAVATWITGGEVYGIELHPFLPGRCSHSATAYPGLTTWGGVGLSMLIGASLVALLWKRRGPRLAPVFALGVFSLIGSGSYFVVGLFFRFGDPWYLVDHLGASPVLALVPGLFFVCVGVVICSMLLGSVFGIGPSVPAGTKILALNLAVQPLFLATLLYRHITGSGGRLRTVGYMVGALLIVVLVVAVSHLLNRVPGRVPARDAATIRWSHVVSAVALALSVVAAELLVFAG